MRENKLKTLWENGGAAMNCWLSMDSSLAAEAMAYCDWDSITVD
ncbi:MAG: 2,4-dihydroxyhept-2-ene-1,7-dioic acid aldolase, partial [Rhodospirillaceae bacterium]|nr:2,4-dihydroxyhept-2-ene-1,7-dioic acid aldolase [Rhodospirillaceae bacterium]